VLGVSALSPTGNVPQFSNRDRIYNDISAPGQEIYSTLPRALTATRPLCQNQGYSDCGPDEFRHAAGNLVRSAAGHGGGGGLVGARPGAAADQVPEPVGANGDRMNALGRLQTVPVAARHIQRLGKTSTSRRRSPRSRACCHRRTDSSRTTTRAAPPPGSGPESTSVKATIDFWDDQIDVYRLYLKKDQKVKLLLNGPEASTSNLLLWKPGTKRVNDLRNQHLRAARPSGPDRRTRSATGRRRVAGTTRRSSSRPGALDRTS